MPSTFPLTLLLLGFSLTLVSGQSTNFVDKLSKLQDFAEKEWFFENIPFVEVPDSEIEGVYYYRWSSLKRHLRYAHPGVGYIITEFVHKVGYSQKFDTINAAAGHHIDEAKWLWNQRYVKDYINVWAREGAGNQQYSEWIADTSYQAFLLNGDSDFIKSMLPGFVQNFRGWDDHFEPTLNLYFLTPHDDAMEHSASSEQTDDPYHGGLGYRPSFNSEMYANAKAIVSIAEMTGDLVLAQEFNEKAELIRVSILDWLWDPARRFFYHVFREENPNMNLLDTREEIGFYPWRFNVTPKDEPEFEFAWEQLFHPEGFNSAFGPTTCEQRSIWFDGNQTSQCCWWNGNSWPYSTGHTLRSLAAQVKRYRPTVFANVDTYLQLLKTYAHTQQKNGKPYVAECHSPSNDFWVCDGRNHSEHYAHSTYNDNILSDLIGIEPQADDTFQVNPLVPASWSYFIAENIPYHGHSITVLYDRDGSHYNTTAGFQIYVNGVLESLTPTPGLVKIPIPPPIENPDQIDHPAGYKRMENYAANVNGFGYPTASASFSAATDSSVWQAVDGRVFYDFIPSNRWSNFGNDINSTDWFAIDFGPGRKKNVSQIKAYIYSDFETGGGVGCPLSLSVEYFDGETSSFVPAENQMHTPQTCIPNTIWTINFASVKTQQLRLVFENNVENETFIGITEVEIWSEWPQSEEEGVYEAEDGYLGNAEITASSDASGGSFVGEIDTEGGSVEFTGVWAPTNGTYSLEIFYTASLLSRVALTTNNIGVTEIQLPSSQSWEVVTTSVQLERGNNVIILKEFVGTVEIDKVKVSPQKV